MHHKLITFLYFASPTLQILKIIKLILTTLKYGQLLKKEHNLHKSYLKVGNV